MLAPDPKSISLGLLASFIAARYRLNEQLWITYLPVKVSGSIYDFVRSHSRLQSLNELFSRLPSANSHLDPTYGVVVTNIK